MKCHYEILDVSQDADGPEIKSAYRKLALKWHPDKNINNEELAKEQFQLVQQAYEVLSDPQERAWYDKHREQILRGSSSEFEDNCLDVFQYFTTTCFKGFNDDERGFYTVYSKVFDTLIEEESEFFDDKEEFEAIPRFGNSTSNYDEVVGSFYSYWMSFSTRKSYVWLEPYNVNETRDRRILKLIEKDNKKVRQKAKKERNEEIRNLVSFVRKRDKRVQEYKKALEVKNLENRQKQEEISKQKRLERRKELHESGTQAEWTKFDNVKSQLEEIEKSISEQFGEEISNSEDDEEENINELYCIACNKLFKTAKAFSNHESSKKHKENILALKELMLAEEEEEEDDDDEVEEKPICSGEENDTEDVDDEFNEKTKKQKKKNKKPKNIISTNTEEEEEVTNISIDQNETHFSDVEYESRKKQKRKNAKKPQQSKDTTAEKSNEDGLEQIKVGKKKKTERKSTKTNEDIDVDHCCATCKSSFPSKNKLFEHLKKTSHGVYLTNRSNNKKVLKEM